MVADVSVVSEFGFELAVCTHLETAREAIVSRQLGASVAGHASRVLDVVLVEPGPEFAARARLTDAAIPEPLLSSDLGPGAFRDWRRVLGTGPGAKRAVERGVDIGYLELERRDDREAVRPVDRYPTNWFDRIVAIENKPDLTTPGALYDQLQFDVSLGLVDAAILVTSSHVTRVHRHRLPDEIGIWRFDPERASLEVIQRPAPLTPDEAGVERRQGHADRTDVAIVSAAAKETARRRLAERAYGKGWRTFGLPGCANIDPKGGPGGAVPWCTFKDRIVDPAVDCGEDCPGFAACAPPAVDLAAVRNARSPWRRDPPDRRRRQATLPELED